ncbi:MAG: multidrug effflux MFS transporter [Pseudomonadota bacterium]
MAEGMETGSEVAAPRPKTAAEAAKALPLGIPEFVSMIAALMAMNALAIDVMLPALDDIAADFAVARANDQQLLIFVYVLGFGAPQLVFGPLSDRYGRRPVLFGALAAYAMTGFACMAAPSFEALLAMRFVQGMAASGSRVVAVSIVRDVFEGRGMARIMSLVMTVFMVIPIVAPSVGQVVLFVGPWQWIFGVLGGAAALVLVWIYLRLPETLAVEKRRPFNVRAAAGDYAEVFRTRVAFGYIAASGIVFGSLFAFIGSAEQVFTEVFALGDGFVLWFAGVALALSAANFTNSRLVERFGMRRLSHGALVVFIAASVTAVLLTLALGEVFPVFFAALCVCFACFGLIGSNFTALAMEPFERLAGTASAASGFSTVTVSSMLGYLIGAQYNGSSVPLLIGFAALGAASLAIVAVVERGRLFASR